MFASSLYCEQVFASLPGAFFSLRVRSIDLGDVTRINSRPLSRKPTVPKLLINKQLESGEAVQELGKTGLKLYEIRKLHCGTRELDENQLESLIAARVMKRPKLCGTRMAHCGICYCVSSMEIHTDGK